MIDPLKFAELKASGRLPSPSRSALQLVELLKREDVTLPEVCRLIQTDPALIGRLLKLANSAAYARPRPAAAVTPDVLMLLGLPAVRNLMLVFSLIDGQRSGASRLFSYGAFWSRALAEACAAQSIGAQLRVAPAAEMFTLGLIADIGRLALAALMPEAYDEILDALGQGADAARLAEMERERFGFDHAELAAALALDWGLPKLFAEAIAGHALPESGEPAADGRLARLTAALSLAHRLADTFLLEDEKRRDAVLALRLRADQLGLHDWLTLADSTLAAWREWGEFLAIETHALVPFSHLVALPAVKAESLRVLVVDDDAATRRLVSAVLAKAGFTVREAGDGEEGVTLARGWLPEIVVTDILMPGKSGLELIQELRASEEGRYVYIIVVTVLDAVDKLVEAFARGADDYVVKPLDARVLLARMQAGVRTIKLRQELVERNLALTEALRRAEEAALTDSLTGLPNRRYAMQRLTQECAAAERSDAPLSLLLIDLDHFKTINDRFGHDAGDAVLVEVGRRLRETGRVGDIVCRFGGEEFLVIAVDTSQDAAMRLAERLRLAISQSSLPLPQGETTLTISVGVAEKQAVACDSIDALVKAADEALYAAKAAGRNRVVAAQPAKGGA